MQRVTLSKYKKFLNTWKNIQDITLKKAKNNTFSFFIFMINTHFEKFNIYQKKGYR